MFISSVQVSGVSSKIRTAAFELFTKSIFLTVTGSQLQSNQRLCFNILCFLTPETRHLKPTALIKGTAEHF
jgi:hypothetical protein